MRRSGLQAMKVLSGHTGAMASAALRTRERMESAASAAASALAAGAVSAVLPRVAVAASGICRTSSAAVGSGFEGAVIAARVVAARAVMAASGPG